MEFTKKSETVNTAKNFVNGVASSTIETITRTDIYSTDNADYHVSFTTQNGVLTSNIVAQIFPTADGGAVINAGMITAAGSLLSYSNIQRNAKAALYTADVVAIAEDVESRIAEIAE